MALFVIAAILSSAHCAEVCSFFEMEKQAVAAHATPEPDMPCHQQSAPDASDPTSTDPCTHHELVAAKQVDASTVTVPDMLVFALNRIDLRISPVAISRHLIADRHFQKLNSPPLPSILRI